MQTNLNANWPTFNPGEFRHQITLLEPTTTMDIAGAKTTFAPGNPCVTAWAKIEYLRGAELIKAGQDVTQQFLKLTSWFRPEFKSQCHIQTPSGSEYIIQAVENVREMDTFMVLMCLGIGSNT